MIPQKMTREDFSAAWSKDQWETITRGATGFLDLIEDGRYASAYLLGQIILSGATTLPGKLYSHRVISWVTPCGRREAMPCWRVILSRGRWVDFSLC